MIRPKPPVVSKEAWKAVTAKPSNEEVAAKPALFHLVTSHNQSTVGAKKMLGFSSQKADPYHDASGEFASKPSTNYPLAEAGHLPLARGANWAALNKHRDRLLENAKDGEDLSGHINPAALHELVSIAYDPSFVSSEPESVYFSLDGSRFKDMKEGEKFSALGMRSTTTSKERARQYQGDGGLFHVDLPAGTRAVRGKVLGLPETSLLPGAVFKVKGTADGVTHLTLESDGTDYLKDLGKFNAQVNEIVSSKV